MASNFSAAYDLDGVLCEAPKPKGKPIWKMSGDERRAWFAYLKGHYQNAAPLLKPKDEEILVLTARRGTKANTELTNAWLAKHMERPFEVCFIQIKKTIKNVAQFKVDKMREHGVTAIIEDNEKVLRAIKKIAPEMTCYLFSDGEAKII